jgi:hypothetical protein
MTSHEERVKQVKLTVRRGSVCQIDIKSERFPGCIVIVDEVRSWGVRCYIPYVDSIVPLRVSWDDIVHIGEAQWVHDQET